MPERASLRADALHDASARLRAVEARLDGLAASCDARFAALDARWAALPAAASFDPFAGPAQAADADVAPGPAQAEADRRRHAPLPSSPRPRTHTTPTLAPRSDNLSAGLLGPQLGAAVAQAMASLLDATPPGTTRRTTARKSAAPRAQAKGASLAPALLSRAVEATLQSALGAAPPAAGRRTAPHTEGNDAAAAGVAAAIAGVGDSLRAVLPRAGASNAAAGNTSHTGRTDRPGAMVTAVLAAPALLQRQLAALTAAPRHVPAHPAPSSSPRNESPAASITPAAARAPSRLLPPSVSNTAEPPPRTAMRPDDPAPAADATDALAELNRRLIDQAWLRGVDLS